VLRCSAVTVHGGSTILQAHLPLFADSKNQRANLNAYISVHLTAGHTTSYTK
jgi:hypothetical protein